MYKKDAKKATFLAAALAMGVLVMAPFVGPAAVYAQVSDSSRSDGIENGLVLIIDKIREEIADLVADANDDNDVENDYNDLVEEVTDDEDIEDDILNSLDDVSSIIEGTEESDVQEVSDVLTEFTDGEVVVVAEDLPDNITSSSVSAAIDSVSVEEVAEELTIDAIIDEVLENNTGLVDDVQTILDEFISEALTQPDADLASLAEDVQDDIEDAVDDHITEDEVADIISGLPRDAVVDAIDNDDVSIDAAVTEAVVRELDEPDEDTTNEGGTETAAASEVESLQEQITNLEARIAQLTAIIDSLTPSGTGNQTTPTSPTMNSTG